MKHFISFTILLVTLFIFLESCRKEDNIVTSPSAKLEFSQDSIIFDTVFSSVGSVTKKIVIRNKNKDKIIISSASFVDGSSQYRMNIDGFSGRTIKDIEIPGDDSVFMFVEVTINPNDKLLPFLVTDQVQFITNGNDQRIELVAFGQNARFFTPNTFPKNGLPDYSTTGKDPNVAETMVWTDSIPIVIYGYLVVDSLDNLIIREGTQIYLHGGAGLWIFKDANIKVLGTKDKPVVFQGDRLDAPYNELSGQWDRIWINEGSVNNTFTYAVIKNAFIGIQAETLPFPPRLAGFSGNELQLYNTVIDNCSALGLLATNYQVRAENTVISNSGVYNFGVSGGGIYNFDNCTFANYWSESTRTTPAVFLVNSYDDPFLSSTVLVPIQEANFRNCLIYGNNESEFDFEQTDESVALNFNFEYCLLKTEADTNYSGGNFSECIFDPNNRNIFANPFENDFHLSAGSPAINRGFVFSSTPGFDLDGEDRLQDAAPDIGAFEFKP